MSKILSDEDGDTIWNDPTPNIDDELDDLIEEAIHTGYVNGYNQMAQVANIAPYNHRQPYTEQQLSIALANKIKEAEDRGALRGRIDELNKLNELKGISMGEEGEAIFTEYIPNRKKELMPEQPTVDDYVMGRHDKPDPPQLTNQHKGGSDE